MSVAAGALAEQQLAEAVAILGARRAPLEVGTHSGDCCVRVSSAELELELDVAIELVEALLTGQLRLGGTDQPPKHVSRVTRCVVAHVELRCSSIERPLAAR